MAKFKLEIDKLLRREGGSKITDDPVDRGGLTRYGISQKAYPKLDIANLTEEEAVKIYKRDYWDCIKGDDILHQGIAGMIFDCAVNPGVGRAVIFAQKALVIHVDGIFGNVTLNALNEYDVPLFIDKFTALRCNYYQERVKNNPTQRKWIKGWLRRSEEVRQDAKR